MTRAELSLSAALEILNNQRVEIDHLRDEVAELRAELKHVRSIHAQAMAERDELLRQKFAKENEQ
jgi:hypothetical protein